MSLLCCLRHRIFPPSPSPFVVFIQRRWKKPTVSAQTRLEDRVRDPHLDKLTTHLKKLDLVLKIHRLMSTRKRGPFVSLNLASRWRNILGLHVPVASFLNKHPHVFHVFVHPFRRNACCRITKRMKELILLEGVVVRQQELEAVKRVKKLLMMSVSGTLRLHALRMIRTELGLPEDFRDSILGKFSGEFRLVDLEVVALVGWDGELGVAQVEKWREREYTEKWLSEFETKFAFPISFPTGFKIERGFRERLKNWQRLPYTKPYERKEVVRVRTCGGIERYQKRAVAVLHELLSLTVEKMVEVDQLVHFRRDFGIEVNVRELLLRHPGIFYISTKGKSVTVFLREAYRKGGLIESNPVYTARRSMLDLVLLGCRKTRQLLTCDESKEKSNAVVCEVNEEGGRQGDWKLRTSGRTSVMKTFSRRKGGTSDFIYHFTAEQGAKTVKNV
ncbi:Protein ROOT PRIMORDIUM DEFECTIVE 1, partial [Mucuna pruriens]